MKELEAEIAAGEAELGRRREELKQDPGGDWAKLADLAKQEQALAKRVEAAMAEWMALSEELGGERREDRAPLRPAGDRRRGDHVPRRLPLQRARGRRRRHGAARPRCLRSPSGTTRPG